nr:host specificity factor TipJ family phage tail protein [uncultured Rhodoferax sp.]
MTKIRLYEHPLAVVAPQEFEVASLGEWLIHHYGDVPTVKVQVFAGEPSAQTEITGDVAAIMRNDAPEYVILQSPGGVDPVSWVVIAIVAVAATALVVSLIPKPEIPGAAVNRTQSSPNNALGQRSNNVRMLERVEDIYGTVKSIPSLMMPTYSKYLNHKKFEYGYYCVSRGYCDVAELKDGDTLISQIAGASASVYMPFTSPNSGAPILQIGAAIIDTVLTVTRANEVDGITLKARNQITPSDAVYSFTKEASTTGRIEQAIKNPNFNSVAAVDGSVTVAMADYTSTSGPSEVTVNAAAKSFAITAGAPFFADLQVGDSFVLSGFTAPSNNGSFVVATKPNSATVTVASTTLVNASETGIFCEKIRNYSGTYTITGVGDGYILVAFGALTPWNTPILSHTCSIPLAGVTEFTDWTTLPDADRTEVWCNITASNGMYKDNGGKSSATVNFVVEIEKLDATTLAPTGLVETVTGVLSGSVTDERATTLEQATAWTGPCRVRMRRTTPFDFGFKGTVVDEIKWADLYSVSPVSKSHFGNKTTIHTVTQATTRATSVKSRQLNCIASRKVPVYDGAGFSGVLDAEGRLASGNLYPSGKLCDIIAAVSVDKKIGARTLADDVDMAQIWGVQQQLDAWNVKCGQFNYTLDNDALSYEETLVLIANAGFCIAYRQNGKIRLAFDRLQTASTALFTHRNKKPNAETITRRFANDADYDGIEFVYMDSDSQQNETITLPLDGSYTKLKKYEIAGIRSFTQAWFRANREYRKLIGQRLSIETATTMDARALLPNARIDIVDNTRYKAFDGEVTGQSGLEITLSKAVEFTPGQPHSIVLMRRDGSLQSIPVTPGATANSVVLQSLPSEALVTSYGEEGVRSIYSFAADSARGAMAWLVQEVDVSDGQYCAIKAINYSPDYYAADFEALPAKAAIIN